MARAFVTGLQAIIVYTLLGDRGQTTRSMNPNYHLRKGGARNQPRKGMGSGVVLHPTKKWDAPE